MGGTHSKMLQIYNKATKSFEIKRLSQIKYLGIQTCSFRRTKIFFRCWKKGRDTTCSHERYHQLGYSRVTNSGAKDSSLFNRGTEEKNVHVVCKGTEQQMLVSKTDLNECKSCCHFLIFFLHKTQVSAMQMKLLLSWSFPSSLETKANWDCICVNLYKLVFGDVKPTVRLR